MSTHRHSLGSRRRWHAIGMASLVMCALGLIAAPPALAQTPAPQWTITAISQPGTNLAPGSDYGTNGDQYSVTVMNTGSAASDGSPVMITDTLPTGVTPDVAGPSGSDDQGNSVTCGASGQVVTCTDPDASAIQPEQSITITIPVDVAADAPSNAVNAVDVTGGGASESSAGQPMTVSASDAPFGTQVFSVATSTDQAGAHPNLTTVVSFATNSTGDVSGDVKDLTVDLPAGFSGDQAHIPTCSISDFANEGCSPATQVGVVTVRFSPRTFFHFIPQTVAVYNLAPNAGTTATLGFTVFGVGNQGLISIRPTDFGLRTTFHNIGPAFGIASTTLTLWGVPADASHDAARGGPANTNPVAFLSNPTACSGSPLNAQLSADSWEDPSTVASASTPMGPFTGCDELAFNPSLSVQPTQSTPDTPSGFRVDLKVPQVDNAYALSSAGLRDATVTLPQGVVMSPSAADGLAACSDAQVGLGNDNPVACPDGSKIGTTTLTTPDLPDQLNGSLYLAGPDSGAITAPPYHMFLTLAGDGVLIKLKGTITPDPKTGQLTTTFADNPDLPFSDLTLSFKDGPRAPLATPSTCGTFTTTSDLRPWSAPDSGPDPTPSDSFTIAGCGNPDTFAPTFTAGSINTQAGAFSPFTLTFSRTDADQRFSSLTTTLPPGLVAKLAGVPLCSDADASAGTCPASSQVGAVEAASGPGSHPFWLPGKAYLTGPYQSGPYGLAVEIPAVAGPFDLGVVVVRNSIHINPTTAQVSVTSDPFPTIIGGIPIQLRTVNIYMNRPDFMINPTSCAVMAITGSLSSTLGTNAPVSSRFQVGGCAALRFSPTLSMRLTGKGQTMSGKHPTLTATLTQPAGQANISHVKVALPLNFALDPNNSQNVCPYTVARAVTTGPANCPDTTVVGHATAVTPLLSQPLSGPVYLVQGLSFTGGVETHTLPTLLIPLRGQIALDLRAQTSVSHNKLVTTFPTIPDAAVSKFMLTINGGKKGILVITGRGRSICGKPQVTDANLVAQSGKAESPDIKMTTPCIAAHSGRKHHKRKH